MKTPAHRLAYIKRWRAANPEKVKAYHNRHNSKPSTKRRVAEWGQRNKPTLKSYRKKWRTEHREEATQTRRRWKYKNPEKYRASKLVNQYVVMGLLIRPKVCRLCGQTGTIDAHHPDYSRRLFVVWLCKPCHGTIHARKIDVSHLGVDYAKQKPRKTNYSQVGNLIPPVVTKTKNHQTNMNK